MRAEELRIGNYVYSNDTQVEIYELLDDEIITTANFEGSCNGIIKPIPLTEEWLLKFGFKNKKVCMANKEYEGWLNFSFHIDINHHENSYFYHWMGGNIELKYVHQLQNLYFALTGKELECQTT